MRGQTGRSPIFHQLCHGSEPHLLTIRGGFLRSARRAIPIAGENDLPGISPLRNQAAHAFKCSEQWPVLKYEF
jgi:hypothetical protein